MNKKHINFGLGFIIVLFAGCRSHHPYNAVSFRSYYAKPIVRNAVFFDGKRFMFLEGEGGCRGGGSAIGVFPKKFPSEIAINYTLEGVDHLYIMDVSKCREFFLKHRQQKVDFYIIHTQSGNFVAKIYVYSAFYALTPSVYLYPDDGYPRYQAFKQVFRAVARNDAKTLNRLRLEGAPFSWPNDPKLSSTIECASSLGNSATFDIIKASGVKFQPWIIASSIKCAVQGNKINILKKLLTKEYSHGITNKGLQHILQVTVGYSSKTSPEVLNMILKYFKLDPDFPIYDSGMTLFQGAFIGKNRDIIKYLLSIGAKKELSPDQLRDIINCTNRW